MKNYLLSMFLVVTGIFLFFTFAMMYFLKENFFLGAYHATVGIYRKIGLKGIFIGVLLYPLLLTSVIYFARFYLNLPFWYVVCMAASLTLLFKVIGLLDYIGEVAGGAVIVVTVPVTIIGILYGFYVFVLH